MDTNHKISNAKLHRWGTRGDATAEPVRVEADDHNGIRALTICITNECAWHSFGAAIDHLRARSIWSSFSAMAGDAGPKVCPT